MKEAMFFSKEGQKKVRCHLCPRNCLILPGRTGFCRVRQNRGGVLFSLVHGKLCSMAADPIEKKPLHHFAPGSRCLSVCTVGCNLDCSYCQNWDISHPNLSPSPLRGTSGAGTPRISVPGDSVPPERLVEIATKQNLEGIAYTYTEPTVFFEYALDTMKLSRKAGLFNVWVSNGFTNPEPALEAGRYLDAINIDLKGSGDFYRELCNAPGESAVKKAARVYRDQGVWVEVTTLVIPGYNDSDTVLRSLSRWVVRNLGQETPVHFSRFHPHFRLRDVSPTPLDTLERAHRIAMKEGLRYVYIGNVPGHRKESTFCPECGATLIERKGFGVPSFSASLTAKRRCRCGHRVALSGMKWSRIKT